MLNYGVLRPLKPLTLRVLIVEHSGDRSTDSEAPDRSASRKLQYETLITSLLNDHKTCLSRIRTQRDSTTAKLQDLISRCARLETAVTEGTKELLKERREKQALEGRVEEMQTSIEQRIEKLRKRLIDSGRIERSDERLKLENERLRASLQDFKVPAVPFLVSLPHHTGLITESTSNTILLNTRPNIRTRT